jgi:hypothetical protein
MEQPNNIQSNSYWALGKWTLVPCETSARGSPALCILGLVDAGLGQKEGALRESRRAIELLPPEKDSVNSPLMLA